MDRISLGFACRRKVSVELTTFTVDELAYSVRETPSAEIVEGLMKRKELSLLYATAKTGKSALALNLGLCVAGGIPFLGKFQCVKSKVLCIQTEVGPNDFLQRLIGMQSGLECEGASIISCFDRVRIDQKEGVEAIERAVERHNSEFLILDPLYTFHRCDENSSSDMAPLLFELRELAKAKDIGVLLVHHSGKNFENGGGGSAGHRMRGSSALADVPDNLWYLQGAEAGRAQLKFTLRSYGRKEPENLALGEDLVWRRLEGSIAVRETYPAQFERLAKELGPMPSSELRKVLKEGTSASQSTVDRWIKANSAS
jgi:hypothetical protein